MLTAEPEALVICQYEGTDHCYLFTVNASWKCLSDSRHASIHDAKKQAAFEYRGIDDLWSFIRAE